MAKIQGVFNNWSGSLGNTVFANWKSMQTIRSKNIPSNPKTDGQISVRDKIKFLTETNSVLLQSWIRRYWDHQARKNKTGWSEFIRENFANADPTDLSTLILSKGPLLPVINLTVLYDSGTGELITQWHDNSSDTLDGDDNEHKTLFDDEEVQFDSIDDDSHRRDGTSTQNIATGLSVNNMVCFVCFERTATIRGKTVHLCSNSVAAPVVEIF